MAELLGKSGLGEGGKTEQDVAEPGDMEQGHNDSDVELKDGRFPIDLTEASHATSSEHPRKVESISQSTSTH